VDPGGWIILFEPELHLGEDILVPDIAGWRRTRMPQVANEADFTLPPDWLCEVLSPATSKRDRADKLPVYARHGVNYIWLVNPLERMLEALKLESGRWVILGVWRDDAAGSIRGVDVDLHVGSIEHPERGSPTQDSRRRCRARRPVVNTRESCSGALCRVSPARGPPFFQSRAVRRKLAELHGLAQPRQRVQIDLFGA
jgi:hypothetical protein